VERYLTVCLHLRLELTSGSIRDVFLSLAVQLCRIPYLSKLVQCGDN